MSGAANPLLAPSRPRRRGGTPLFVPLQEQRDLVAVMSALGASEPVMLEILRRNNRNNVPCRSRMTLRKAFRAELKQGKENLITTLGLRMVRLATTDGPHSFSACAFLLRTWGGPQWRLPKGQSDADLAIAAAAAAAAGGGNSNVVISLPHNFRDPLPAGAVVEHKVIDVEPEPEEGNAAPDND